MTEQINNKLSIYKAKNGEITVEVDTVQETVWLSLNQMATVFERDKSVISRHLKNIFKEEELDPKAVVAKNATTAADGKLYQVEYYNLDAILSVGYRVNSKRGIEFRKWASKILKEYLIEGYSINQDKLANEREHLNHLTHTVELLTNTLINQNLVTDTGKELLELIRSYSKTWDLLLKYDEGTLDTPGVPKKLLPPGSSAGSATTGSLSMPHDSLLLGYEEATDAIGKLKHELGEDAGYLFGKEREELLKSILGNIDLTFDGKSLYSSQEEKAAHLLYFIIKDHPFSDGNKRIGCLLFLLYLTKAKIDLKRMQESSLTALALLIAESDPSRKDLMIKLIMNLL